MCNFLLHFSWYSIALNLIFPGYTFSLIFTNFLSSLPQVERMTSQVRNHYSQKNQEAHPGRALAFKKEANLRCPSNVCLPIIFDGGLCYGWPMSGISVLKKDDDTNPEIVDDDSKDPGESTLSSVIEEDELDHHQVVLLLGRARQDMLLSVTWVPQPKKRSCTDTVIAHPPLPNSQIPEIQLGQWHHHCSSAKIQPSSTNYQSLIVHHPPRRCRYARPVETRMFHNPRPVEIRMFPNTTRLLKRHRRSSWRQLYSRRLLGQYHSMTSTQWLKKLGN